MKKQIDVRLEIINILREWDCQDDTDDKLSYRDLAIKIEDIYLLYAQQVGEDVRQRCYDNAEIDNISYYDYYVNEDSILNTEIILP